MEHWLRTMLEWDPRKRGGSVAQGDSSKPGRVQCFEILAKILQTRVRTCTCTCTVISRESVSCKS